MSKQIKFDHSAGSQPFVTIKLLDANSNIYQVIVAHQNGKNIADLTIEDPLDAHSIARATAVAIANCKEFALGIDQEPYLWTGRNWASANGWIKTISRAMHAYIRSGATKGFGSPTGLHGDIVAEWICTDNHPLDLTAFGQCNGVPVADGVITIEPETGNLLLRPHRPDNHNLRYIPVESSEVFSHYADMQTNDDNSTLLSQFLHQALDPDQFSMIRKWFGLHLIAHKIGNQEKMLYMHGRGGNGKSVIQNLLTHLLTKDAVSTLTVQQLGQSAMIEQLSGKVAMIGSEASVRSDIERLKALISWEGLTVNPKYRDPYQIRPMCLITQASNEEPRFRDDSRAMERRLIVLKMENQIPEDERIPDLANVIMKNEYPALVAFALIGATEIIRDGGLLIPDSIQTWTKEVCREQKSIDHFAEQLEYGNFEISELEIYQAFRMYCKHHNLNQTSMAQFQNDLHAIANRDGKIIERRERAQHYSPQRVVGNDGGLEYLVPQLASSKSTTILLGLRISSNAEIFGPHPVGQPIPGIRRKIHLYEAA